MLLLHHYFVKDTVVVSLQIPLMSHLINLVNSLISIKLKVLALKKLIYHSINATIAFDAMQETEPRFTPSVS